MESFLQIIQMFCFDANSLNLKPLEVKIPIKYKKNNPNHRTKKYYISHA